MVAAADQERACWVMLSMAAGIGPVRFRRLLEVCGGAEAATQASDLEMAAAGLERRTADSLRRLQRTESPETVAARLDGLGITALTLLDPEYPSGLRQITDPPPVLFVKGSLPPDATLAVALVGTRRATPYGRTVAERLARDLAQAGVTVVSGLARGVDTVAHQAALDAGGCTLAVLGNGLDQVYPPENARLASRIVEHGALVSEFSPGVPPDAVNFPRRNRLISGLSAATVIVEAGARSGALITADYALEQGREVFAVPGSILSVMSVGPNSLLKQGASPVTCGQDILDALGLAAGEVEPVAHSVPKLDPDESSVWQALEGDPRHIDDLARELKRGAGELSATLAVLELKGFARQVGAMTYARA